MNKVLGGWQLAGILTTGTGMPYSVTFTPTLLGWLPSRADITSYAGVWLGLSKDEPLTRSCAREDLARRLCH
jgi:hypothetical protein